MARNEAPPGADVFKTYAPSTRCARVTPPQEIGKVHWAIAAFLSKVPKAQTQHRESSMKRAMLATVGSDIVALRIGLANEHRLTPATQWRVEGALPGLTLARRWTL